MRKKILILFLILFVAFIQIGEAGAYIKDPGEPGFRPSSKDGTKAVIKGIDPRFVDFKFAVYTHVYGKYIGNWKDYHELGTMMLFDAQEYLNLSNDGRTFLDPEQLSEWTHEFNGNESYISSVIEPYRIVNTDSRSRSEGRTFQRYYVTEVAHLAGAAANYIRNPADPNGPRIVIIYITRDPAITSWTYPDRIQQGERIYFRAKGMEYSATTNNITYRLKTGEGNVLRGGDKDGKDASLKYSTSHGWSIPYTFKTPGNHYLSLRIRDGVRRKSRVIHRTIHVYSPPDANFYVRYTNPKKTRIDFTNQTTEIDGDSVSYKWYKKKRGQGDSKYQLFSRRRSPSISFTKSGYYVIKLVAADRDGSTSHAETIHVTNRRPIAGFRIKPNPTNRLTEVRITSKAYDPDGDRLTYKYAYRKKGTSNWKSMRDAKDFTWSFNRIGIFQVRQIVRDTEGSRNTIIKNIDVNNLLPNANFTVTSSIPYEGDTVKLTNQSSDPENDRLSASWKIVAPNGETTYQKTWNALIENSRPGTYDISLTITDEYGERDRITKSLNVSSLDITGTVSHTARWKEIHRSKGHVPKEFYSGERFLLAADVTRYPIDYVRVDLYRKDGTKLPFSTFLDEKTSILYKGRLYDSSMTAPASRMKGSVYFKFTVHYQNDVLKTDIVNVNMIGSVYEAFKFHRTY